MHSYVIKYLPNVALQCFDTAGWAAESACGL